MLFEEESPEIKKLNETLVTVEKSLSPQITNSIYYSKLKHLMFSEIVKFCKEKYDVKQDLLNLRSYIGEYLSEEEIRNYLEQMKNKYNDGGYENVGLDYHIESTRYDYGVCVFVIIKRDEIYAKKFVFRFRKNPQVGLDLSNLSVGGVPVPEEKPIPKTKDEMMKDIMKNIERSKLNAL